VAASSLDAGEAHPVPFLSAAPAPASEASPAEPQEVAPETPMPSQPAKTLETFPNPRPGRDYEISFETPEFTCLCPRTGQPDFGTIRIRYVPRDLCVELKSLKLYLWSFRDEGHFHEAVTNRILDDLVAACRPQRMSVEGDFLVRGGIHTVVRAEHREHREEG
jgi:7-cyano-7-deazaguanine reductase